MDYKIPELTDLIPYFREKFNYYIDQFIDTLMMAALDRKMHPADITDVAAALIDGYKQGVKAVFELLTKWTPVTESMPEDHPELLRTDIPDVECTVKVLVKTETGSVIEAGRLKSAIDTKEWKWFGGFSDEEIVEWRILY